MKLYILICCILLGLANDKVFQNSSQDTQVKATFKPVVYGMTIDPKTGKRTCGIINRNPDSSNSSSQSDSLSFTPKSVPKEILEPTTPQLVPSESQEASPQISSEDSTIALQLIDDSGFTGSLSSTNLQAEDSTNQPKTLQPREDLENVSEDRGTRNPSDKNRLSKSTHGDIQSTI